MSDSFPREIPDGFALSRTTPEFTEETMPAALRRAHRLAEGLWGRLRVHAGSLQFRSGDYVRVLNAGDGQAIPPATDHDVEPIGHVRFVVEFFRPES